MFYLLRKKKSELERTAVEGEGRALFSGNSLHTDREEQTFYRSFSGGGVWGVNQKDSGGGGGLAS